VLQVTEGVLLIACHVQFFGGNWFPSWFDASTFADSSRYAHVGVIADDTEILVDRVLAKSNPMGNSSSIVLSSTMVLAGVM